MTTPEDAKPCVIEPLDPARHDRAAFSCGVAQVDNFFRRTANKLAKAGNVRTFVMVGPGGEPIGFYAVNAHAVDYAELPGRFARDRPAHGRIPAAYISMIGVDGRFQGRGHGGDLLADCLTRLAGAADTLGIAVVMLDVLDCGDPEKVAKRLALYTSYGFEPLPSDGLRLFLPMATVRMLTTQKLGGGPSGDAHRLARVRGQPCAATDPSVRFGERCTANTPYRMVDGTVRVEWLYGSALYYISKVTLQDGKIAAVETAPAWAPIVTG